MRVDSENCCADGAANCTCAQCAGEMEEAVCVELEADESAIGIGCGEGTDEPECECEVACGNPVADYVCEEETILEHNCEDAAAEPYEEADEEGESCDPIGCEAKCCEGEGGKLKRLTYVTGEVGIEPISPDEKLSYRVSRLSENYTLLRVFAKTELKINYPGHKELVIPAGTKGGYISNKVKMSSSWIDEESIFVLGSVLNSVILQSTFTEYADVSNSYVIRTATDGNAGSVEDKTISKSILKDCTLKGHLYVNDSSLINSSVHNSTVERSTLLSGLEAEESYVSGINHVSDLRIYDGKINRRVDFIQVTSVGHSNRTVCAYKSHRDGIRVTTGCFKGTLEELKLANAKTHLDYYYNDEGYLVTRKKKQTSYSEWAYKEYDMLIKYIEHHFKLDINTQTINTVY